MKLITAKLMYEPDPAPDLSHLGYFTNRKPGEEEFEAGRVFKHKHHDPSTLDYFISAECPEIELRKEALALYKENYERIMEFDEGLWHMQTVRLEICVEIGGTRQVLTSPGQKNIPSDCDCLGEVAEEELDLLEPALKELGFSVKEVLELGLEI
jgi:hypothetical protein